MSNVRKFPGGSGTGTVAFKRMAAMAALGVVAGSAAQQQARAADWVVADDNWTNPAAWSIAAVPGPTEPAFINFVGGIARVNTDLVDDVLTLRVQNGATLSIEPGGDLRTVVGNSSPVVGDANFASRIGDGSAGTLAINDGTFVNVYTTATGNQAADTYIGVNGGSGTLTMSGTTPVLTTRDLRIGSGVGGTGTATISAGTINTNFVILGHEGGSASSTFSGGTMNAIGQINIAQSGNAADTNGTLVQTGGTMVSTSVISVGRGGTGTATNRGFGTFTLNGGQVTANFTGATTTNGHFVVGMNGGKGTMTWNAGNVNTQGGFYVAYNDGGNVNNRSEGALVMHAGTATVGGNFVVGYAAATGSMTMDGGTVTATGFGGVGFDDRTNTARATLPIGTLDHTAGSISANGGFFVGSGSGTGLYNLGGTAVLNAGTGTTGDLVIGGPGDNATVAGARQGNLNISGTAVATVAGILRMGDSGINASSNPTGGGKGTIVMTGGTLNVNGTGTSLIGQLGTATKVGTGSFTLNGATAVANFVGGVTVGDTSNTNGSVTLTDGSLTVGGALNFGRNNGVGSMSMTGGTLKVTNNSLVGQTGSGNGTFAMSGGNATFSGNLTAADSGNSTGLINVTGGTLNVAGTLIAGRQTTISGVINQSGGIINAGAIGIRTGAASVAATDFNVSGGTLNVTGAVTNNSTFDFSNAAVANIGGVVSGSGTVTVADTAAVNAGAVRQGSLAMTGGTVTIAPTTTGTADGVSVIPSYSLTGTAKFDLTDNKLITNVALGTQAAGVYSGVQGDIQRANNFGAWDQPGLTTSKPDAAGGLTSIGAATGEQILGLGPTDTALFAGQTITGASTVAMYTYAGDANLDGFISGDDYAAIDFNIAVPGSDGWYNGDFNWDGIISGDDYAAIDFNIVAQGAPFTTGGSADLSGVTAVPEPTSLALLGLSALAAGRRRRNRASSR